MLNSLLTLSLFLGLVTSPSFRKASYSLNTPSCYTFKSFLSYSLHVMIALILVFLNSDFTKSYFSLGSVICEVLLWNTGVYTEHQTTKTIIVLSLRGDCSACQGACMLRGLNQQGSGFGRQLWILERALDRGSADLRCRFTLVTGLLCDHGQISALVGHLLSWFKNEILVVTDPHHPN